MRIFLRFTVLLWAAFAQPAAAQFAPAATLVADEISLSADGLLVASGHVEIYYDGTRLSAARIIYDPDTDRLTLVGPIFIETQEGDIFTATQAEIDPRLENGILRGVRVVLDRQLQLAAQQADRRDGRYSQLYKVTATSCVTCTNEVPLWDIRAERVVHDSEEHQLYFDNATLRFRGTPIFWLPYMRLPDPTLTRYSGFLLPRIRSSNLLGIGVEIPYFLTLGDHRDLTVTSFLSPQTRTLSARFRRAYFSGDLSVNAALSQDTLRPEITRYYLFAEADFELPGAVDLSLDLQRVSDNGYLLDYGISGADRLESGIRVSRVEDHTYIHGEVLTYQGLLEERGNESVPPLIGNLVYEHLSYPEAGGRLLTTAALEGHWRPGTEGNDRDVVRAEAGLAWENSWVTAGGIVAQGGIGLSLDAYQTFDDTTIPEQITRALPWGHVSLAYPLARRESNGVVHQIEPLFAASWSRSFGKSPANEDSTRTEFDEANLLALTRFAGQDRREQSLRLGFGARASRFDPAGWSSHVTIGRIWQNAPAADFTESSGLDAAVSDLLVAGSFSLSSGVSMTIRSLYDQNFRPSKSEAEISFSTDRYHLGAAYTWLTADLAQVRNQSMEEWLLDASWRINDTWKIAGSGRFDAAAQAFSRAAFEVNWENECLRVGFSASRRFTSNTAVEPSTDIGLWAELLGFSAGRSGAGAVKHCTG